MSDIAVQYVLATSGGTVTFNNGDIPSFDDMLFITDIKGLDMGQIRIPQDDAPQAPGGLDHDFIPGPMHIVIEGEYLVQSTSVDTQIQILRNAMNAALKAALNSTFPVSGIGSLTWTEAGLSEVSVPVRCEIPLETSGVEQKLFTFGLYSSDPAPS